MPLNNKINLRKNMKKLLSIFIGIIVVGLIGFLVYQGYQLSNPEEKQARQLEKLRVQAGWLLNGEFANVCSAIVNGYYEDEGLDVELIPGGPAGASFIIATNTVAQDQKLDIAIDGDIIPLLRGVTKESKTEQLKMRAFAAFWNENPFGFIVRKDSGITSLKDFALKRKSDGSKIKVGITADSVIQYAIADYAGVPVENLDLTIVGYDASSFLAGQVDALAAFWTTQAYEVEKAGIDYTFLSASELPGFSQPSMVAITRDEVLKNKPNQLTRWLKATIKGSEFVIKNPEKAAQQIIDPRCGGPNFEVIQEEWLIKKSIPIFDKEKIGWIYKEQILDFAEAYKNLNQIPRVPKESELLDYSILNRIYK